MKLRSMYLYLLVTAFCLPLMAENDRQTDDRKKDAAYTVKIKELFRLMQSERIGSTTASDRYLNSIEEIFKDPLAYTVFQREFINIDNKKRPALETASLQYFFINRNPALGRPMLLGILRSEKLDWNKRLSVLDTCAKLDCFTGEKCIDDFWIPWELKRSILLPCLGKNERYARVISHGSQGYEMKTEEKIVSYEQAALLYLGVKDAAAAKTLLEREVAMEREAQRLLASLDVATQSAAEVEATLAAWVKLRQVKGFALLPMSELAPVLLREARKNADGKHTAQMKTITQVIRQSLQVDFLALTDTQYREAGDLRSWMVQSLIVGSDKVRPLELGNAMYSFSGTIRQLP